MIRTSGTRRAGRLVALAMVIALMGCSAGQVTQTASGASSVYGLNTQAGDGSVLIRNLAVAYPGTAGHPDGATVPLELHLFNQTGDPVTVSISSRPPAARVGGAAVVSARGVRAGTEPAADVSAPATQAAARITIEPLGFASFRPGSSPALYAVGLTEQLGPGEFLNLVFEFGNGAAPLVVQAPMAIPASPATRVPGDPEHHGNGEPE